MKTIRTRHGWQGLEVAAATDDAPAVVIGRRPLEVSNKVAGEYEKLADAAGIAVVVEDADGDDPDDTPTPGGQTPDLSRGVAAATGTGSPVTTPDGPAVDTKGK